MVIASYVLSNCASLSITECNDEYITFIDPLGKFHHVKLYCDTDRAYFKWGNMRVHLDECMRV